MSAGRILITGAGVVSAIGCGKQETLSSLLASRSGVAPVRRLLTQDRGFLLGEVPFTDEALKVRLGLAPGAMVSRTSLLGIVALQEALEEAGLEPSDLKEMPLLSGTTVGGMDTTERFYREILSPDSTPHDACITLHDCGASTEAIAGFFGGCAFSTTLSTACSSAANALIFGANLIKAGLASRVVAGGSESLSDFHLHGFDALMIVDRQPCRPFDRTRAGLNLGEGAAFLVLESEESVRERGTRPIAVLSGYGNACDAFHQTASSENGEGPFLAMSQALAMAGLSASDIDYINAHGTGTPNNDASESTAIRRVFGPQVPPVSSTKAFTGHTTSASGSIEAVFCLLALQHEFFPANLNWREPDPACIRPLAELRTGVAPIHVLCNAFGFGGNDSSLLLSKIL